MEIEARNQKEEARPVELPVGQAQSAFPVIESTSVVTIVWDPQNTLYPCIFCKQYRVDEMKLGPLYRLPEDSLVTHYFCMLFSAGLIQNGDDRSGILGFLPKDIFKEAKRAQRLRCSYCHQFGASIGCNMSRCKVSFHFPCGLANEASFQFSKNYQAFCKNHTVLPEITVPEADRSCPICLCLVDPPERPITGPCCRTAIFHKLCLQKLALNAGYFFKCPTCNSHEDFSESTKQQGIFVPEQDASWEREPNAYRELYETYNHCDAEKCECPKGRDYGANKGNWLLARCRTCGSAGTHRQCAKLATIVDWACPFCLEVEARTPAPKEVPSSTQSVIVPEPTPSTSTACFEAPKSNKASAPQPRKRKVKNPAAIKTPENETEIAVKKINRNRSTAVAKSKSKRTAAEKHGNEYKADGVSESKRAKRTGMRHMDLSDDDVDSEDLKKLQIHPGCVDYFPHSKDAIKQFATNRGCEFPDHRNLVIRVELIDLFIDAVDATENPVNKPPALALPISRNYTTHVASASSSDNAVIISQTQPLTKARKVRKTKRTNWSKGLVKRKKKTMASKQKSHIEEPNQPDSSESLAQVSVQSTKPVSSDSKAILLGIRRSRESLIQLQSQTSNKSQTDDSNPSSTPTITENGVPPKIQRLRRASTMKQSENTQAYSVASEASDGNQNRNGNASISCHEAQGAQSYTLSNGVPKSSNITPAATSSNAQPELESANGASLHQPKLMPEHASTIQNCSEKDTTEENCSSQPRQPTTNDPHLASKVQSSAKQLVQDLMSLSNSEANEKLRILELTCPDLFKKS